MSLNKKECAKVRSVINRLHDGPAWFKEEPSAAMGSALLAELRTQSKWWAEDLIRELQQMLPHDERVRFLKTQGPVA